MFRIKITISWTWNQAKTLNPIYWMLDCGLVSDCQNYLCTAFQMFSLFWSNARSSTMGKLRNLWSHVLDVGLWISLRLPRLSAHTVVQICRNQLGFGNAVMQVFVYFNFWVFTIVLQVIFFVLKKKQGIRLGKWYRLVTIFIFPF